MFVTPPTIPPTAPLTPWPAPVEPLCPVGLGVGFGSVAPTSCMASRSEICFTSALSASVLAAGALFGTRLKSAARREAASRVIFSTAGTGSAPITVTRSSAPTFTAGPLSAPALSSLVTSTSPRRIVIVDR